MVEIPQTLLAEVDALVREGAFPNRETAVSELVRLGLRSFRGGDRLPRRPPAPPGVNEPHDDRPISVRPDDVNWAE